MSKLVIFNWKNNPENLEKAEILIDMVSSVDTNLELVVAPPNVYLQLVQENIDDSNCKIASQDIGEFDCGAETGQTAGKILKQFGVEYALIGHSETRNFNHLAEDQIVNKVWASQMSLITPVLCVGEKLGQDFVSTTTSQIQDALKKASKDNEIVIAYEPVFSIGSGKPLDLSEISERLSVLKEFTFSLGFSSIKLLYGGSVNSENILEILELDSVDGVLIGGASVDVHELNKVLQII